jgi:mannose-6-phosphate isomerase-like protein (cupin superfamily)
VSVLDVAQLTERPLDDHWGFVGRTVVDRNGLIVLHADMEEGGGAEEHVHANQEHLFIVLAGRLHMTLDGAEDFVIEQGRLALIPPAVAHAARNPGPGATRYVVCTYPA